MLQNGVSIKEEDRILVVNTPASDESCLSLTLCISRYNDIKWMARTRKDLFDSDNEILMFSVYDQREVYFGREFEFLYAFFQDSLIAIQFQQVFG